VKTERLIAVGVKKSGLRIKNRTVFLGTAQLLRASCVCCLLSPAVSAAGPVPAPFYKGGDISMIAQFEKDGLVLKERGQPVDLVKAMLRHGCNTFRVRLFVNPNGKDGTIQNLDYVIALGQRIKNAGGLFLLDFHYSDTWADPGHQAIPAAWKDLALADLVKQVEFYTLDVMTKCQAAGCPPDLVQVGNEIDTGILKPLGDYQKDGTGWQQFGQLVNAGVRGVRRSGLPAQIIIHSASGGHASAVERFCQRLQEYRVDYDILGLSFYSEWQGLPANLTETLAVAATFGKPIIVVEVAYPWKGDKQWYNEKAANFPYPFTPEGQRDFLAEIIRIVRAAPKGLGRGVIWWYPEAVKCGAQRVWKDGACALFDDRGEMLPALAVFGEESQAETK